MSSLNSMFLPLGLLFLLCLGSICQAEEAEDKCNPNPCQNNATCRIRSWARRGFVCSCRSGYYGDYCEKTSRCLTDNPCVNGARCYATSYYKEGYFCDCPRAYYGKHCEGVSPCATEQPCKNGGRCYASSYRDAKYWCACGRNWYGVNCTKRNPCLEGAKCQNGGTCQMYTHSKKGYECTCPDGYGGDSCQFRNPCKDSNPCMNQGQCEAYIYNKEKPYKVSCQCPRTHWGDRCENESPCKDEMCKNGGKCWGNGDISCECPAGFRGQFCERKQCPMTVRRCGYRYYGKGKGGKGKGQETPAECRSRYRQGYLNQESCVDTTAAEIIKLRDCNCHVSDLWHYNSERVYDFDFDAIDRCYIHPDILPTLGCSNRTLSCIQTVIKASRYFRLSSCSDGNKALKNEVKKCVDDYEAGQLTASGNCAPLQKIIDFAAPLIKMAEKVMCSGCEARDKYDCFYNKQGGRHMHLSVCGIIKQYSQVKSCFVEKLLADKACAPFKDDLIKVADDYFPKVEAVTKKSCQRMENFYKTRVDVWNCTAF